MFGNHLKIAFRNIFHNVTTSIINISGLSIGLAVTILIVCWIQDELSFDRFNKNYHSIYRIVGNDGILSTPQPLAPVIKDEIPEIVNAARISAFPLGQLEYNKNLFKEKVVLTEYSLFEIFSFPFVEGNPESLLINPESMVISQHFAKKIFGNETAIGKTVTFILPGRRFEYTITGVYKNLPANSHLQTNYFVSFHGFVKRLYGGELKEWSDWSSVTYIQTSVNCKIDQIKPKIMESLLKHTDNKSDFIVQQIQPLKDIHLHPLKGEYSVSGDIKYISIFSVVALIIIIIACINYVNLTTASAIKRVNEVGIKKAIGATRASLIRQFTIESFIIVLISLNFAILLINLFIPAFNRLTGKYLDLSFTNLYFILLITGCILLIGLSAGFFPALYLSSFNPRDIFQSKARLPGNNVLNGRLFTTIQFALSVAVIIGALVINKQMAFVENIDPGFDKNNLVYFELMDNSPGNIQFLKNKLLTNPDVLSVTSNHLLSPQNSQTTNSLNWEGKSSEDDVNACIQRIDYDFLKVYNARMKQGRFFSEDFITDKTNAFVINESAAEAFKMESPIGKTLSVWDITGHIIGVIKDYQFKTVHQQVSPVILMMNSTRNYGGFESITLRINPENMENTLNYARQLIHKHNNGYEPEFHYLDEEFDNRYHAEKRLATIFNISSILAIFISCIGLFAIVSHTVKKRTKEIGIRKVNGASVASISGILSIEIILLVVIAILAISPVAWYFSNKWLQNFAFRTGINWWIFLLAGGIVLLVALLSISWHIWLAANRNPVESLRYE